VLARFGLVRGSFIPPHDLRELRLVSRYRRKLTAMRASEINRLHKILDDGGIKLGGVVTDLNGLSAREMVAGLIAGKPVTALLEMARGRLKSRREDLQAALDGDLTARHRFILQHIHNHIEILEHGLAELDAYILAAMAPYQWAHRLLQTVPGIDQIASALILIEIGDDMTRFGNADRLAAWAALCPGNNESAGKRKSARIGKASSVIRYIMCECANSAWKTKSSLAAKYRSLMVRKTHKKAIIALAHKMIRLIFLLLTRKVAYHDPQIDYQAISAKKNAPRWIRQLKVIGQWPNSTSTPATT
jgi:transposase